MSQKHHSLLWRTSFISLAFFYTATLHAVGPTVYELHFNGEEATQDFDGVTDLHQMTISMGNLYNGWSLDYYCRFRAELDRPGTDNDITLAEFQMRGSQPIIHIGFPPFTVRREDKLVYTVSPSNLDCTSRVSVRLFVDEWFSGTEIGDGPDGIVTRQ